MLCDVSCSTCTTSAKNCTKCASDYFPLETNINDCRNEANKPTNTYLEASINKYRACDVSCNSCVDTANKCTQCAINYFILLWWLKRKI